MADPNLQGYILTILILSIAIIFMSFKILCLYNWDYIIRLTKAVIIYSIPYFIGLGLLAYLLEFDTTRCVYSIFGILFITYSVYKFTVSRFKDGFVDYPGDQNMWIIFIIIFSIMWISILLWAIYSDDILDYIRNIKRRKERRLKDKKYIEEHKEIFDTSDKFKDTMRKFIDENKTKKNNE